MMVLKEKMFSPLYRDPHFKLCQYGDGKQYVTVLVLRRINPDGGIGLSKEILDDLLSLATEEHGGSFVYRKQCLGDGLEGVEKVVFVAREEQEVKPE